MPQRIFTFLTKTPQTANKYTYRKQEKAEKHRSRTTTTRRTRHKARQNNVRKRHRSGKEKHTEKAHTTSGEKSIKSYSSCVCVCVFFLAKQPPPLLKSTLIFPLFTIAPPFPFPARACVVRVVVVQWWYVAMCFCVGVFCVFSPPCARWLTVQKCLRRCLACACVCCGATCVSVSVFYKAMPQDSVQPCLSVCVSVFVCLCVDVGGVCVFSPPCARWYTTQKHLFCHCCRQCEMCTAYRAIGGYGFLLVSVFCYPRRAPWG